ncbi:methyltransferase domain-containing protein [bacterium]|nr:methyltransferase domain-containing protein [bacterium]
MTGKHANNWDNRYDQERYFYGTEPNHLVARVLPGLPRGRVLCLAEGEGRNAVYAATLGHQVVAVDESFVGRRKALELAEYSGVDLEYRLDDVIGGAWTDETWDVIVLCFAHLDPAYMPSVHAACAAALAPGGTLVLCSFSRAQFGRKSGGPPRLEWLHDATELERQFPGLTLEMEEKEVHLSEGTGHVGAAMVIEMVGRKPAR